MSRGRGGNEHESCRTGLTELMQTIRQITTPAQRKESWAYIYDGFKDSEFHGPDEFFWHGKSCCLWQAKYDGWYVWLKKNHPLLYDQLEKEAGELLKKFYEASQHSKEVQT